MKASHKKRMTVLQLEQYLIENIPPGISTTQIYNHIRKARLKKDKAGRIDLEEFLAAYMKHKADDNKNPQPAGLDEGQNPKRYKEVLQCMILKLNYDKMRDELMTKKEHREILISHMSIVKPVLDKLPGEIGELCKDSSLMKAVKEKCDRTINELGAACEREGI